MPRPIVDAHLDLSWSALSFDRDLTHPLSQIRRWEGQARDSASRGHGTVCFEEMRRGSLALCMGTLLARAMPDQKPRTQRQETIAQIHTQRISLPPEGARRIDLDFGNTDIAHGIAHGQLAWYRLMEARGYLRLIRTRGDLDEHWSRWQRDQQNTPPGLMVTMEGADPIVEPDQASHWWDLGLRALMPVHYGQNRYAVGTGFDGPLTDAGRALLAECERLGMIVDVTHLSDTSMWQTLDAFGGRVIASHHNCRSLVPGDRQLSDEQIKALIERDAVIGSVMDTWMLYPDWEIGQTDRRVVGLDRVADQIDHICQLAGNTRHAAIGSDLDGGFGTEQSPREIDSIADLQKLEPILESRGYTQDDLDSIFHGNWLGLLRQSLPMG